MPNMGAKRHTHTHTRTQHPPQPNPKPKTQNPKPVPKTLRESSLADAFDPVGRRARVEEAFYSKAGAGAAAHCSRRCVAGRSMTPFADAVGVVPTPKRRGEPRNKPQATSQKAKSLRACDLAARRARRGRGDGERERDRQEAREVARDLVIERSSQPRMVPPNGALYVLCCSSTQCYCVCLCV